ncbi:MAG: transglutaminase family protein, partial [Oscillospiraceae bacterium]|nr:transglutaminase family protein [Oscillospiraceae bacterium]
LTQAPFPVQRDGVGKRLQIFFFYETEFTVRYTVQGSARVDLSALRSQPPHPMYAFPSAYTWPDRAMKDFLAGLDLPSRPRDRACALAQAVGRYMDYVPGVTGVDTKASEAFAAGRGVCQDFAHIYLALARQAGLSARYVNGLPEGEGSSHAWCQVWLDGLWTGIDPTRGRWTDASYLQFGVGRDFVDCPFERGVFLGQTDQRQTVFMRVEQQ